MNLDKLVNESFGNLSICDVMIGDKLDEQRDRLIKEGLTPEKWNLMKGTAISNTLIDVYAKCMTSAELVLEGLSIHRIFLHLEFAAFPHAIADSFLGVTKEMEKSGIAIVRPQWQTSDEEMTVQYHVHNVLYDTEVHIQIRKDGTTSISLEHSSSLISRAGEIQNDAIEVYTNISKLVRRNKALEEHLWNPKPNTIFL